MNQVSPEYYDQDDNENVCYLCGNPKYRMLYQSNYFDIPVNFQRCSTCGMIKQTPMPTIQFFEWFFNSDIFFSSKKTDSDEIWGYYDYFADEPNRMDTSKWRYKKLSKWFDQDDKPLNIMKIGPATGTFLYVAKENGHNVRGCDVSSEFADYAQTNYEVTIDNGRYEQMNYDDGQFDTILLLNVIENVPNQVEFLEAIHRTLSDDGLFIFNFVDMRNNLIEAFQKSKYFMYRPPICYAYTYPVMEQVMDKFGFKVVDVFNDVRVMNVEKILSLLGWRSLLKLSQTLNIHRLSIRLYAYPSKIVVARKK